jgi:hypothetical protein
MTRIFQGVLAAAAATIALTVATSAGDMSGMYGNTIECKDAKGAVVKVWVEAGGTYSIVRPDGSHATGKWVDDGTNVCYTDTDPPPPANAKPVCNASALHKVGDTWDVIDPFGGHCTATLTAGHH